MVSIFARPYDSTTQLAVFYRGWTAARDAPRGGISLDDAVWVDGGIPRQSYASPWVVASPKHAAIVRQQGRLEKLFVQTVVDALGTYLEPPSEE